MRYFSLTSILIVVVCAGCTTGKLSKRDAQDISSISISIDTTITSDVSGDTDSVDLPLNKTLTDKLLVLIKTTLEEKGFKIADHHISKGMANSAKKYYVVMTESDRERKLSDLEIRPGPYYSDRLESEQLKVLYKDFKDHDDNPAIGDMGFKGDAALVVLVQGRLIGLGKSIGAYIANVVILPLAIFDGGGHFGSSTKFMDTDDTFLVQMRLYSTTNGNILWESDIKQLDSVDEVLETTERRLRRRIPSR